MDQIAALRLEPIVMFFHLQQNAPIRIPRIILHVSLTPHMFVCKRAVPLICQKIALHFITKSISNHLVLSGSAPLFDHSKNAGDSGISNIHLKHNTLTRTSSIYKCIRDRPSINARNDVNDVCRFSNLSNMKCVIYSRDGIHDD